MEFVKGKPKGTNPAIMGNPIDMCETRNNDDKTEMTFLIIFYIRGAQPFWVEGQSVYLSANSRAADKIMIWTFETKVSKTESKINLTSS